MRSTGSMRRRCACTALDVPLPYAANLEKLALPQPEWSMVDARDYKIV